MGNQTWEARDHVTPSLKERRLPTVCDIYKLLPRTNCRKCGYLTCLAFAVAPRASELSLEQFPLLVEPEYSSDREHRIALLSLD